MIVLIKSANCIAAAFLSPLHDLQLGVDLGLFESPMAIESIAHTHRRRNELVAFIITLHTTRRLLAATEHYLLTVQ